ncbi:MAG: polysaccharide deacetylase family protein [bacterium]|nr:polysaccharide deacetylase family protein [bacterium]
MHRRYFLLPVLTLLMLFCVVQPKAVQAQSRAPFRVYMMFEDGPTDVYTPQILDILAQYNAKATFFVNGYQVPGRDAIMQRIISEGHAIANHLWEEPGFYQGNSRDDIRAAYARTEEAIRASLGSLVGVYDRQTKLFRHPGGSGEPFPALNGEQVITYNWNVQSDDCGWRLNPDSGLSHDEQSLANILDIPQSIGERYNVYHRGDGALIAFHDINRVTGRILPVILDELTSAGATFEALPRPWDDLGTMPVALAELPQMGNGTPGVTMRGVTRDYTVVRARPQQPSELVVVSVPPHSTVTIIGRYGLTDLYTPLWYQVQVDGQTGWIFHANLRVLGPIPALPVVQVE